MNKLLVVVPYKLWFCSNNTTRDLLSLQIHALEDFSHQHIGYGVGGVLINGRRIWWVWFMSLELFRKSWSLCINLLIWMKDMKSLAGWDNEIQWNVHNTDTTGTIRPVDHSGQSMAVRIMEVSLSWRTVVEIELGSIIHNLKPL
jgi:hypothetical protein